MYLASTFRNRGYVNCAIAHEGRVLHRAAGLVLPQKISGCGIQCVEHVVVGANVHDAVRCDCGRPDDIPCLERPDRPSRSGVQRVHAAIVCSDIDRTVRYRRRVHGPAGHAELPDGSLDWECWMFSCRWHRHSGWRWSASGDRSATLDARREIHHRLIRHLAGPRVLQRRGEDSANVGVGE